jgi:hypothetical protein
MKSRRRLALRVRAGARLPTDRKPLKYAMTGVSQHVSEEHPIPLRKFDFRHNSRVKLGDDTERARRAIVGAEGKRVSYRRTP